MSAAAIAPSNSPASSPASARRCISSIASPCPCAASTRICAAALAEAMTARWHPSASRASPNAYPGRGQGRAGTAPHPSLGRPRRSWLDYVVLTTGRKPNLHGLNLEAVGCRAERAQGAIAVDNGSRTNVPHIYAIGDVTDRLNLTPVAIAEGHALADTLFGGRPARGEPRECADRRLLRPAARDRRAHRGGGRAARADGYLHQPLHAHAPYADRAGGPRAR